MQVSDYVQYLLVNNELPKDIQAVLLDHFQYSIQDIDSYDELTDIEKMMIPEDIFDYLTE